LQLGATDESHIIGTIEYWNTERRRWPQYDHVAVIVAEEITARFFNVISLFNGFIPIIAIQMSAIELGDAVTLFFSTVLGRISWGRRGRTGTTGNPGVRGDTGDRRQPAEGGPGRRSRRRAQIQEALHRPSAWRRCEHLRGLPPTQAEARCGRVPDRPTRGSAPAPGRCRLRHACLPDAMGPAPDAESARTTSINAATCYENWYRRLKPVTAGFSQAGCSSASRRISADGSV
jgi:hypothetical protein